jgi:methyl-accepting chemotaxis protein
MLRNISISIRIGVIIALLGCFIAGLTATVFLVAQQVKKFGIADTEEMMLEGQKEKIRLGTQTMATALGKALNGVTDDQEQHAIISRYIKEYRFEDDQSGYYYTYKGTVIFMHPTLPNREGEDLGQTADVNGVYYVRDLYENAKRGGGFVSFIFPKPGPNGNMEDTPKLAYVEYIPGTDIWISTGIYIDNIDKHKANMEKRVNASILRYLFIIIGVLGALIALILIPLCVLITRSILKPLKESVKTAERMASGNLDAAISVSGKDEISVLQNGLIVMAQNLRKAMDDLEESHIKSALESGRRLNAVVSESFGAMETITQDMNKMDEKITAQIESIRNSSESATQIFEQADTFDKTVHEQSESISESSLAIERTAGNITSIRSIIGDISRMTHTLTKSSDAGNKMLRKLAEELRHIEEQSATLQTANKTIADIAGQTNILAMNAAIEAAHAGESGRGFAVVAGEIRKLAELAAKESTSISEEIKKLEQALVQIGLVSNETVGAMDAIFNGINAMSDSFTSVNRNVEEQAVCGAEMLAVLKTVQNRTGEVRNGAVFIHERSNLIYQEMEKLQKISKEVAEEMREMRLASGAISSFLKNAKELALVKRNQQA